MEDSENMRCPNKGCKGGKMVDVLVPHSKGKKGFRADRTIYLGKVCFYQRCTKCGSMGLVPTGE